MQAEEEESGDLAPLLAAASPFTAGCRVSLPHNPPSPLPNLKTCEGDSVTKGNLARVIAMSALAGTRTFAAPALVSRYSSAHNRSAVAHGLRSRQAGRWLPLIAAGEMVADKFPIPNRTAPLPLAARAASGAVVAMALAPDAARRSTTLLIAAAGALAAVGVAEGTFHLRRLAHNRLQIPSPVLGAIEDAGILAAGVSLLRAA
jgi:hypothetical protein